MKRRIGGNLNIGTSSLLLIFIVLSLVSFAVLSLSSALNDKKMVQSTLDRSTAYYEACNQAEYKLKNINEGLLEDYKADKLTSTVCTYDFIIDDTQVLKVSITTHSPDASGYLYTVNEWKVVNTISHEIDNHLDVFMPQ